jgi:peptide/nickel transport system substrate-binding protein
MNWISMNLAVAPFDDLHVRRAVQFVTNKRALASTLNGSAAIQTHAIPDAFEGGLLTDYDPYATANQGGSLERAKAEMALSRYDADGDGICDAEACRDVYLPVRNDRPEVSIAAASLAGTLAALGITLRVEALDRRDEFGYVTDPSSHAAMAFPFGWSSDYLSGSAWFVPLATSESIGGAGGANMSMIGATAEQLRSFGYDPIELPSLDNKINSCIAETGSAQFACWAETDQYLMERVASWVPLANDQFSRLTSSRVTAFNFDAPLTMPALDQIGLGPSP